VARANRVWDILWRRDATVYYMAANPRHNALRPNCLKRNALIAAGAALLVALIAHWRLLTHYLIATAAPSRGDEAAVGDSGGEYLRIRRGKYGAGAYVAIAFWGQLVVVGTLLGRVLSLLPDVRATSDVALTFATVGAVSVSLGTRSSLCWD
jgi:hypothetical protein